ncbi:MAG TPA: ACP S-malonyltransferase, partial [Candidatus Acetothermia bacterium]|nr:ACP S-malonyltransferase [Candidatus Acetothermia bacterium]
GQGRIPDRLSTESDLSARLLDRAEKAGLSLARWIEQGRTDRLAMTDAAQPLLFLESLDQAARLRAAGWKPIWTAGHSLGEYAALVEAGVLDAASAMEIVLARGRLMQGIPGSMAAILKLDWDTVSSLCEGLDVVPANHNGPRQVVVSGSATAVQQAVLRAEQRGGRGIPLAVSGPFHSPHMAPAQAALAPLLQRLEYAPPRIGFVSSTDGEAVFSPDEIRRRLLHQITSPVRWADVLGTLKERGVTKAIEVGQGSILTEIGRRSGTAIQFLTSEEALHEKV